MDPDIQEIVTRFKLLYNNSARHITYHLILDQLNPYEWRDVKERINQRSFQKDILGALPLEIVVQIIQLLALCDLHILRRVSRRWNDVLSSNIACSVMFRRYTGGSLSPDGEFKSAFAHYSRQRFRLEQGNPIGKPQVHLPFVSTEPISHLDYSNGKYAWKTDNGTTIMVYDMCSQKAKRFCTMNREPLYHFRLSESILAVITYRGHCHAWNIQTEDMHTFRCPNVSVSVFAVGGSRISIYYKGSSNIEDTEFENHSTDHTVDKVEDSVLMHYDMQTRITHTIRDIRDLTLIGFGPSTNSLTIACIDPGKEMLSYGNFPCLRVVRYELHGSGDSSTKCTHTLRLPLSSPDEWVNVGISYDWQDSTMNRMGILFAANYPVLSVTYDPKTDKFWVHRLLGFDFDSLCMNAINVSGDIVYYVRNDEGKRSIWVSNPECEIPLYPARGMDLGLPRDPRDGVSLIIQDLRYFVGDSRFVSMVDPGRSTRVWSFEETNQSGDTIASNAI
ncbi:hypothetical protein BJX99DRAFT_230061 [Aspergillus californicus]